MTHHTNYIIRKLSQSDWLLMVRLYVLSPSPYFLTDLTKCTFSVVPPCEHPCTLPLTCLQLENATERYLKYYIKKLKY